MFKKDDIVRCMAAEKDIFVGGIYRVVSVSSNGRLMSVTPIGCASNKHTVVSCENFALYHQFVQPITPTWIDISHLAYSGDSNTNKIKSVTVNKKKKKVTVVFGKNDYQIATCVDGDTFDPSIGVALAMAYKAFGSKTKFHKFVNSIVDKKKG